MTEKTREKMTGIVNKFDDYTMRLLSVSDVDQYYHFAFEEADEEANYFTGTVNQYSKVQIQQFLEKIVDDCTRYDFIICCADEIVGEIVLNDIDETRGHYRICIYNKKNFSKGIGYKATIKLLEFAFEVLGLEYVDLEVFPFNDRGIGLYQKIGFEIMKRMIDEDAEEPYRDIIEMRLFKDNFKN